MLRTASSSHLAFTPPAPRGRALSGALVAALLLALAGLAAVLLLGPRVLP